MREIKAAAIAEAVAALCIEANAHLPADVEAALATALGLAIEAAPTHVAGLPVAVNVSCHATRRASAEL